MRINLGQAAVLVLAAGRSSRLGRPKQLETYDGRTLLEQACRTALEACVGSVFVVLGSRAEEMAAVVPKGVGVVLNDSWSEGLSSSIRAGIRALAENFEVAVVMLADQPRVRPQLLRDLVHSLSIGVQASASRYPDGLLGVPAAFHRSVFGELMKLSGDSGAKRLIESWPHVIAVDASGLEDLDEEGDFERLKS